MVNQVTYDTPQQFMDACREHESGHEHLLDEGVRITIRDCGGSRTPRKCKFTIGSKEDRGGKSLTQYYDAAFFKSC